MDKVSSLISQVSASSEEQSKGIEQINLATGEMDKATQATAANAEESAAASEELAAQAKELNTIVRMLATVIGGQSGSSGETVTYYAQDDQLHAAEPIERRNVLGGGGQRTRGYTKRALAVTGGGADSKLGEDIIPLDDDELKKF